MCLKSINNNRLLFLAAVLYLTSCQTKSASDSSSTGSGNITTGLKKNYDWTGTYELNDKVLVYSLKLHRRSVDGSYEMLFFSNNELGDIYKSSTYDARDDSMSICVRFLNNFQMDAKPLGFKSGDTLFILQHRADKTDTVIFKSFHPVSKGLTWKKTGNNFN